MNFPTIVVGLIVLAVFTAIVTSEVRRRKNGKGGCACGCSGCPSAGLCAGARPAPPAQPKD